MRRVVRAVALATLVMVASPVAAVEEQVLDTFDDLVGWTAAAAPGASLELARDGGRDGGGMRLDFDFQGGAGWVIARKAFSITLPANYAFTFFYRGDAPPNNIEFKIVDPKGDNVWWYQKRDVVFPGDWREMSIKKNRLAYAWGTAGGGSPKDVGFIEIAITASTGGKGSVWIDDLTLETREPEPKTYATPTIAASTFVPGHEPERVLDHDHKTGWRSGALAPEQWLLVDFHRLREFGGLVIDWDDEDFATAYKVEISDDGTEWSTAFQSTTGSGRRMYVYMPDTESRYVRLALAQSSRGQGYGIRSLTVMPVAFSTSINTFMSAIAADEPPGAYPKYFSNLQTYWTVVGVDGGAQEALLNEEGMLETGIRSFSIEPFLFVDGTLVTWHDVETSQELELGYLPLPSVTWRYDWLTLNVRPFAAGTREASTVYARYEIESRADVPRDVVLFLTLRPVQVLPPWQNINMVGGVTSIRSITFEPPTAFVNGDRTIISLTPPDHFGAATLEQGLMRNYLLDGRLPLQTEVTDPFGYASGAFEYRRTLAPGAREIVDLAIPFQDPSELMARVQTEGATLYDSERVRTIRAWEGEVGRVKFSLPPTAWHMVRTLESTLAYVLINRDGPAIQPGPRTYARSWIRDGALTSQALLELGHTEEPREFLRWYAGYQQPNGRIPCCVDRRGADPTPENDSEGEFIYGIAEYYRFTRDIGFVYAMWPRILRAVDAIRMLRDQRTTEAYQKPDTLLFYGLLPASISHEGYSGNPVHSYWDDFWALKGLKDAADLAVVVGDEGHAVEIAELRDALHGSLYASITRAMAKHKVQWLPASADLGDLDPSSTAIAVCPGGELDNLPRAALDRTFEIYWDDVQKRRRSPRRGAGHSAYELRNVEVFVRLGWRARAFELLEILFEDQRPAAWNQWQEITWADPTEPKFIGDMPHTWVASGFIRALRSLFVYERDSDRTLVLGAGLPASWVESQDGVAVERMPTHYGVLSYSLRSDGDGRMRLHLGGDLSVPPGGIVVQPPLPRPLRAATVDGEPVESAADHVVVRRFPADLVLSY